MTGLSATSTSAALFAGRRNGLEDRRHPALPPALEVRTGEGEDVEFANCASGLALPRPRSEQDATKQERRRDAPSGIGGRDD